MWRRQVRVLQQQGYEPVAPDLPGFGAEPAASKPYAIVERVAPLLPACLVGNSFGGLVALETALAHAESVARLVLVDPALRGHDWSTEIEKYWEREEELLAQERFDDATQLTLATFVSPDAHDTIRPMQRRAYELQAAAADPLWPPAQPLSALRPPTLVLVGEHDLSDFHEIGLRIAREAPDARMEVVPGAMHVPSLETPAAFDRLLLDFLAAA
jgi:3-oxoadipate enol-lactonase